MEQPAPGSMHESLVDVDEQTSVPKSLLAESWNVSSDASPVAFPTPVLDDLSVLERSERLYVFDIRGKRYLDALLICSARRSATRSEEIAAAAQERRI